MRLGSRGERRCNAARSSTGDQRKAIGQNLPIGSGEQSERQVLAHLAASWSTGSPVLGEIWKRLLVCTKHALCCHLADEEPEDPADIYVSRFLSV